MTAKPRPRAQATVADLCEAMETIAPLTLAQEWDNVGLLAGDTTARVRRVLLAIDLTPAVVEEAIRDKIDAIVAYHPPIHKPISSLRVPGTGTDAAVFRCIRHGVAIYSPHTALDAAEGGTNDVMASLCGISRTEPIEYVDGPSKSEFKLVVFVSQADLEKVADAMFGAGAGHIGDYSRCSFRSAGQGTFWGGESTSPTIGERGRLEYADEIRLETIVQSKLLAPVVNAMVRAHSYEEPAYDIYPLKPRPVRGIGRHGPLPSGTTLGKVARRLKRATHPECVQIIGPAERELDRAVIVVGSAGQVPFRLSLTPGDVIVTGEIRHHDALTIGRLGCTAIALGHWASERPVLSSLAERLEAALSGITAQISLADQDPFHLA